MTSERQHLDINLQPVFEALEGPLALIDSPERRAEMQRFVQAGRVHQERAIFDVLSRVAEAVNHAGADARLRLEYHSEGLRLVIETGGEHESPTPEDLGSMEGETERVTIRLPQQIKQAADEAARQRGISVNSWYVRNIARDAARQLRRSPGPDGRPFQGWPFQAGPFQGGPSFPGWSPMPPNWGFRRPRRPRDADEIDPR